MYSAGASGEGQGDLLPPVEKLSPPLGDSMGRPWYAYLVKGLLQLRFEHDSSTIRARFEHDTSTTRYNTLRGFFVRSHTRSIRALHENQW